MKFENNTCALGSLVIFGAIHLYSIRKATNVLMLVEELASRCGYNFNSKKKKIDKTQVLDGETFVELVNDLKNKRGAAAGSKEIIDVYQGIHSMTICMINK